MNRAPLELGDAVDIPLSPHLPQKRASELKVVPHRGHGRVGDAVCSIGRNVPPPQRPQNLTPSAKRDPQFEHATIPGITLDCPRDEAPPALEPACDG